MLCTATLVLLPDSGAIDDSVSAVCPAEGHLWVRPGLIDTEDASAAQAAHDKGWADQ